MEVEGSECQRALKFPEILEHIFGFCNIRDLKCCRLVSKLWESASRGTWKTLSKVKLRSNTKVSEFVAFLDVTGRETYYSNFAFSGTYEHSICKPFWRLCGANIKCLELDGYTFPNVNILRNVIYDWTPNITTLELKGTSVRGGLRSVPEPEEWMEPQFGENWNLKCLVLSGRRSIEDLGISYMELLAHFPGLETLIIESMDEQLDKLFKSISVIRKMDPSKLKLKRISTLRRFPTSPHIIGPGQMTVLTYYRLSLESISIGLNGQDPGNELYSIIKANGNSIKRLVLEQCTQNRWIDPLSIFDQPEITFRNLTQIILRTRVFWNFTFLRFTPNLIKLNINIHDGEHSGIIEKTNPVEMVNVRLEHCIEFEFNKMLHVDDMEHLVNWLPRIEQLTIPLDNPTFTLVCTNWRKLTSLNIPESFVDECTFTGLDDELVNLINETDGHDPMFHPNFSRPNITYLSHLRTLVMMASRWKRDMTLGCAAARFGICELNNLKQVSVRGYTFKCYNWNELNVKCRAT